MALPQTICRAENMIKDYYRIRGWELMGRISKEKATKN